MKCKIFLGLLVLLTFPSLILGCCGQPCPAPESLNGSMSNESESAPLVTSEALSLSDLKEMQLYENAEYGFSMAYPSTWIEEESDPNDAGIIVGFLAPDEDINNPMIYIYAQIENLPIGQKITLNQYSQAVINNIKASLPDLNILEDSDISIGGQQGHAIAYNLLSDGLTYRVLKAWIIQGEKAYIFTYNAPNDRYEEFSGDASKIIGSLKVA